jgi:hypothetical protein
MKVRVIGDWTSDIGSFKDGQTAEMSEDLAKNLAARGYVKYETKPHAMEPDVGSLQADPPQKKPTSKKYEVKGE